MLPEGLSGVTASLRTWVAGENLGSRWWGQDTLDPVVLDRLRAAAASKPALEPILDGVSGRVAEGLAGVRAAHERQTAERSRRFERRGR